MHAIAVLSASRPDACVGHSFLSLLSLLVPYSPVLSTTYVRCLVCFCMTAEASGSLSVDANLGAFQLVARPPEISEDFRNSDISSQPSNFKAATLPVSSLLYFESNYRV